MSTKGSIFRVKNPLFVDNAPMAEAFIVRSQTEWLAMAQDARTKLQQEWGEPPEMRFKSNAIEMWFPWKTEYEMWETEVKIASIAVSMMLDAGASAANAPEGHKLFCHDFSIVRNVSWANSTSN